MLTENLRVWDFDKHSKRSFLIVDRVVGHKGYREEHEWISTKVAEPATLHRHLPSLRSCSSKVRFCRLQTLAQNQQRWVGERNLTGGSGERF